MLENNTPIPVSVLIVDDNPAKLTALAAALTGMDIEIVTATSGTEALRKLMAQDFATVLLDVNMPIMDGFDTAEMIRRRPRSEHLPILFITAERLTDEARLQGYGLGAVDYILSPILPQILRSKVAVFADLYRLREQIACQNRMLETATDFLADHNRILEEQVMERTAALRIALVKNQEQLVQLQDSLENTVRAMAAIVEMRDPYTAGHQVRVADLAAAIAKQMALPEEQIHAIHLAGIVHDLGKIRIPAEILSKPGKITDLEFGLIKAHAQAGYDILKDINFPWPIAQMVLQHHERLDGSGYPQGLKGDAILPEARILSVADVVEAISAHRPYRPGLGIETALAEITKHRGTHYDPQAVDACVALFREQGYQLPN